MKRSVAFYRDLLGLEMIGRLDNGDPDFDIVYLKAGGATIELFEFTKKGKDAPQDGNEDRGLKHIGFQVESCDEVAEKLKANGVEFTMEPFNAAGGVRIAFFRDPDGVLLELVEGIPQVGEYR